MFRWSLCLRRRPLVGGAAWVTLRNRRAGGDRVYRLDPFSMIAIVRVNRRWRHEALGGYRIHGNDMRMARAPVAMEGTQTIIHHGRLVEAQTRRLQAHFISTCPMIDIMVDDVEYRRRNHRCGTRTKHLWNHFRNSGHARKGCRFDGRKRGENRHGRRSIQRGSESRG